MFRSPQKSLIALFFSHAYASLLFFFAPLYIFLCLLEFFNATEVPLMLNFEFGSDFFFVCENIDVGMPIIRSQS